LVGGACRLLLGSMSGRKVGLCVSPWSCQAEWQHVRDLVIQRDVKAIKYIEVWRARVTRLPTGVETTHSLLEAATSTPHTTLSLATAVNRFLNHVSHLAMNLWGLTKLHEAGARLAVPEWLVELRHETTHGQMPGLIMLRAGVQFGLAWLDVHYWGEQGRGMDEEVVGQEVELHKLLECYMYLKVYQCWGTEKMTELQSQEEVWSHLLELWKVVKGSQNLEDLGVKQAVGLVKTLVCNLCDGEEGLEILADVLVTEDLLVPEKEFFDSLEGSEDSMEDREVKVPRQLLLIWCEFIQIIDRGLGIKILVDKLLDKIKKGGDGLEIAAAWVVVLAEGMAGVQRDKCIALGAEQVDLRTLECWLDRPNKMILQLCGLLCEVGGLGVNDSRRGKVEQLVKVAVGGKLEGKVESEDNIHTEIDLFGEKQIESHGQIRISGWVLDSGHNWDNVKFGGWEDQNWDVLWVEGEWGEAEADKESGEEDYVPKFDIDSVDWLSTNGVSFNQKQDSSTPHFYSNGHVHSHKEGWAGQGRKRRGDYHSRKNKFRRN